MILRVIIPIIGVFLFAGCAQMAPLTGGPKDNYAPVPSEAKVFPKNYSTNFNSKGIILEFDEYFKLDQPQNISINPGVQNEPTFRVKGKRLFIELNTDLEDNTTYVLNFGNSIKDITEGNILKNFKYIFSTGDYIDSLEYRGNVYWAKNDIPAEGAMVGLYKDQADSIPYLSQPNYVGITNEKGWFSIENISQGDYKVVALSDENANYSFQETSESIGFSEELVSIDSLSSSPSMIDLYLFKHTPKKLLDDSKVGYKEGLAQITFNRPVEEGQINFLEKFDIEDAFWNPGRDSLKILTRKPKPKLQFVLKQNDLSEDTITVSLTKSLSAFKLNNAPSGHDHHEELVLSFNSIVGEFYEEDFDLLKDSTRLPITILTNPQSPNTIRIKGNYEVNTSYSLKMDSAAVMDVFGRGVAGAEFNFKTYKDQYYGSVRLSVITEAQENLFVELLTPKGVPVRTSDSFYGAGTVDFDHLHPGKYIARITFDRNFNNKWDTGDYLEGVIPEKVSNYSEVIVVRSNWAINEKWEVKP